MTPVPAAAANPVVAAVSSRSPFTYFHTHVLTPEVLGAALAAGRSIELDIAVNDAGELYLGHPMSFYRARHLPDPTNLPLEEVVTALRDSEVFVVLDCKDVRALPQITEIVTGLGAERTLFHSWVEPLLFEPYPVSIPREPQWPIEDLPMEPVLALGRTTGVPLMLSCRGLTLERLAAEGPRLHSALDGVADGGAVAINFNLPGAALPPPMAVEQLVRRGLLPAINVDGASSQDLPLTYLGMTDLLSRATPFGVRRASGPSGVLTPPVIARSPDEPTARRLGRS